MITELMQHELQVFPHLQSPARDSLLHSEYGRGPSVRPPHTFCVEIRGEPITFSDRRNLHQFRTPHPLSAWRELDTELIMYTDSLH
jgi:hypothetical protein